MAKGRIRHRAERLLAAPAHSGGGSSPDLPDLSEDDVWPASLDDDSTFPVDEDDVGGGRDPGRRASHAPSRRWVERHVGGLTLAFEDMHIGRGSAMVHPPPILHERHSAAVASSAPVNVPVWPRSSRSGSGGHPAEQEEEEEEEDESAEGEWVPPHEYLARAHGRSMATTSVLEGAGRTLKGRDMSRVRDAVWSQTGFFG